MDHIHAVCFVASAGFPRLTESQRYIFTEVLKLYGKDIAENIVCVITFCDGTIPSVLAALECSDSPFKHV